MSGRRVASEAEQATIDALRDAAVAVAHLPGYPTSVTYDFARVVWGKWWELKRASEAAGRAALKESING